MSEMFLKEPKTKTCPNGMKKKLAEVVAKKGIGKPHNPTAGICKHFLQSVEDRKYGWFWECPNGDKCQYRHALPNGFVLKRDQKKEDKKVERAIEDEAEEERQKLKDGGTPLNEENFKKWKEKRNAALEKERKKDKAALAQYLAGRKTGKQLLEEFGDKFKEEDDEAGGDGDGSLDISQLLKLKKQEEDQMDRENAAMVEIMQKEMEDLEKEGEKRVDAEAAQLETQRKVEHQAEQLRLQQGEAGTTTTTTTTTTSTPTTTTTTTTTTTSITTPTSGDTAPLQGVDTALFAEEDTDNLPEFDDDNGADVDNTDGATNQ